MLTIIKIIIIILEHETKRIQNRGGRTRNSVDMDDCKVDSEVRNFCLAIYIFDLPLVGFGSTGKIFFYFNNVDRFRSANAFVFYGLSLNSTNLSGNKFLNYILVCLVEIPALTLAWICMNKIGRRWSLAGSLFLCATTCIACAFVAAGKIELYVGI